MTLTNDRREVLRILIELEEYVLRGGEVEVNDPEPRGRKGPDHKAIRFYSFRVSDPARFDAVAWEAAKARERRRSGPG